MKKLIITAALLSALQSQAFELGFSSKNGMTGISGKLFNVKVEKLSKNDIKNSTIEYIDNETREYNILLEPEFKVQEGDIGISLLPGVGISFKEFDYYSQKYDINEVKGAHTSLANKNLLLSFQFKADLKVAENVRIFFKGGAVNNESKFNPLMTTTVGVSVEF